MNDTSAEGRSVELTVIIIDNSSTDNIVVLQECDYIKQKLVDEVPEEPVEPNVSKNKQKTKAPCITSWAKDVLHNGLQTRRTDRFTFHTMATHMYCT